MKDAVLDKPGLILADKATAHAETGKGPAEYASPNWSFSAGAVLASAQDMAAFAQAIDKGVLPPEIFTAMTTPSNAPASVPFKYGLGWILL